MTERTEAELRDAGMVREDGEDEAAFSARKAMLERDLREQRLADGEPGRRQAMEKARAVWEGIE
jgi:hypothetical protein